MKQAALSIRNWRPARLKKACSGRIKLRSGEYSLLTREDDTCSLLTIKGQMTLANCRAIKEQVLCQCGKGRDLHIDLSAVDLLDSAGLAVLLECLSIQKHSGSTLRLLGLRGSPLAFFNLNRLDHLFELSGPCGNEGPSSRPKCSRITPLPMAANSEVSSNPNQAANSHICSEWALSGQSRHCA